MLKKDVFFDKRNNMTETDIFRKLKYMEYDFLQLKQDIQVNFKRIESWTSELGIPDCYFYTIGCRKVQGWIEIKVIRKSPKRKIVIPYRPGQRKFLYDHQQSNDKTYVLLLLKNKFHLINKNFKASYSNYDDLLKDCKTVTGGINSYLLSEIIN